MPRSLVTSFLDTLPLRNSSFAGSGCWQGFVLDCMVAPQPICKPMYHAPTLDMAHFVYNSSIAGIVSGIIAIDQFDGHDVVQCCSLAADSTLGFESHRDFWRLGRYHRFTFARLNVIPR